MFMEGSELPKLQTLEEFEREVAPQLVEPFKSRFGALFLDELDAPGPEHEWLIDDVLSVGDKCIIGGPSQSGKSFLAIHAGMCIATGTLFFGRNVKQGLVIYQAGEGSRGVKKRLRAWRKQHGVEFSRKVPFVLLRASVDLYRPDGDTAALLEEIKAISAMFECPLAAVFIDTLATAAIGAEENSAKDMGVVMANIARINAETHAHVCLVHHMNAGGDKLRGSTAIYANIDQSLFVKRDFTTNIRTASMGKQRDDEDSLSFQFELKPIEVGYDEKRDKPITSCICFPVGEREAIRRSEEQKGFALGDAEIVFMKALLEAERKHGQPVPMNMMLPSPVRSVVSYDHVKRAYVELSPNDQISPEGATDEDREKEAIRYREALKKRLQRVRESLTRLNVIGAGDNLVWWTGKPLRAFPQTSAPPDDEPSGDAPEF